MYIVSVLFINQLADALQVTDNLNILLKSLIENGIFRNNPFYSLRGIPTECTVGTLNT